MDADDDDTALDWPAGDDVAAEDAAEVVLPASLATGAQRDDRPDAGQQHHHRHRDQHDPVPVAGTGR